MATQGAEAVISGQKTEYLVSEAITRKGWIITEQPKYNSSWLKSGVGRSDFLAVNGNRQIRIEVKNKNVGGSDYQKIAYWLMCLHSDCFPEKEQVLVMSGRWDDLHPNLIDDVKRQLVNISKQKNIIAKVIRFQSSEWDDFLRSM